MCSKIILLTACLGLLGGLRLTSTTTTTTFVAAMSIANQDLERYFRSVNATQTLSTTMSEERIALDVYTYAYLSYSYKNGDNQVEQSDPNENARYGEGKIMNVTGKLVHISDADDFDDDTACAANIRGTNGAAIPAQGVPWIALVRRGRCTFEEKVKNVHAKGAVGVIVFNDKEVMNLEKMQIKGKNRDITAVITYQHIGMEMAHVLAQGFDVDVSITSGRSGTRPINSLNRTSVLFVSISFIVLMVISLVWLIFYYVQRFRYLQTKDQHSRHLCSVTKKAIMKIPTKTGKSSDEKDADSDCCAICIETYKPADTIRVLPCKHEFHKNCIDPWLIEHRTCPMCKLDVLKFYGYVFLGSEESILEYEPDRSTAAATGATTGAANAIVAQTRPGAIGDLLRSRDFVIDFPRIFVLEAGGATGRRDSLLPAGMPERSQSSVSLAHAKDWMSQLSNKLEEQHGLRRLRKNSERYEMQENLLAVRSDSMKKRRSRSADGRYSHGFYARKDLERQQQQQPNALDVAAGSSRRNSATLAKLTEASYAQSKQRQKQDLDFATTRRRALRRVSDFSQRDIAAALPSAMGVATHAPHNAANDCNTPTTDVSITIQINGEGVDLD